MQNIPDIYDLFNPPYAYRFPGHSYKKQIFLKIQKVKQDINYFLTLINNPEDLVNLPYNHQILGNNPFGNIIQDLVDYPDRRYYYNRLFQRILSDYQKTLKILEQQASILAA